MLKKHRYGLIFWSLSFIIIFGFSFYLKINDINLDTSTLIGLFLLSLMPFIMLVGLFSRLIECIFCMFDESDLNNPGIEIYGLVCGIEKTDDYLFGGHFYSAKVYLEVNPYEYKVYDGSIGLNKSDVKIGDVLKVRLHDEVITILEKVDDKSLVSDNLVLNFNYEFFEIINKDKAPGEVIIDGVKYKKKVD